MAKVDPKKLGALVDKHAKKKAPPKKPNGGGGPPSQHAKDEAEHEGGGETAEHEQQEHDEGGEHDAGKDAEIAEQQASRIENGNGDDELHELAGDIDAETADEVPQWALDEAVWTRAREAVDNVPDLAPEDYGAVLVHTYEALGGEIEGHESGGGGGDHEGGDHGGDDHGAGDDAGDGDHGDGG